MTSKKRLDAAYKLLAAVFHEGRAPELRHLEPRPAREGNKTGAQRNDWPTAIVQLCRRGLRGGASRKPLGRRIACGALNHNRARHLRMKRTEVLVCPGRRQGKGVGVIAIQRLRFESPRG